MFPGRQKRYHLTEFNKKSDTRFLDCSDPDITANRNASMVYDNIGQNLPTAGGPKYVIVCSSGQGGFINFAKFTIL